MIARLPLRQKATVLCLVLGLAACSPEAVELLSSLSENEANTMITVLNRAGIDADKSIAKDGTATLNVARSEQSKALSLLREQGLPRQKYLGLGEVFKKDGMVSSPLEERARYLYAISQGLEDTLMNIDGVILAKVHLVLPEKNSLLAPGVPASAGVFLKHGPEARLKGLVPQLRRLVANAIPGLETDRVSVALIPARPNQDRE